MLVVWELDRLYRSIRDVLTIKERLVEASAGFLSLTEAIDTPTPAARMMMQIFGAFAEFEQPCCENARTPALDEAREDGRIRGRRLKLTEQQQSEIWKRVAIGNESAGDAVRLCKSIPRLF